VLRATFYQNMPIRLRLTLWYVGLLAATLVLFSLLLVGSVYIAMNQQLSRELESVARRVAASVLVVHQARQADANTPLAMPPLDAFGSPDIFVELRLPDGNIWMRSANLGEESLELSQEAYRQAYRGLPTLRTVRGSEGGRMRILTYPVIDESGRPIAIVQVGKSLDEIDRNMRRLITVVLFGGVLALLAALVVGAWLAQRALAPVDQVTQAALRISRAEDLDKRIPEPGTSDEIGRLVSAFNEMLARLDDVFRDQQRFVADVSHELRTPLTSLQATIDLLKRGVLDDPEARSQAIKTVESEVARLNRLVADLLLLARADEGEPIERKPVELDTLLLEVYLQAKVLAEASGKAIRVRLGHEDQALVLGDRDRLKQLLLNLVDNAIKYTREGEVVLSLYRDDGWVRLVVQDTGIGIPEEAIPHLFRRFYRVDKARSRELGGSGLGLAIVRWIAEAHGGYVTVESREGKGSTFTVHLPLAPQPAPREAARGEAGARGPRAEVTGAPPRR